MKPKELFQRILNKDGYVIYRNTGIISFDEKSNFIQGITGGGAAFELVPAEIVYVIEGLTSNPFFEVKGGDAVALFFLAGPSVESVRFKIDNLTAEYTGGDSDGIFELTQIIIDEQVIESAHELGIDYFDDKLGQYSTIMTVYISNMEGYTPLAAGEHPYSLSANNEEVISGNFTVE